MKCLIHLLFHVVIIVHCDRRTTVCKISAAGFCNVILCFLPVVSLQQNCSLTLKTCLNV